jgi:hypothetical protein
MLMLEKVISCSKNRICTELFDKTRILKQVIILFKLSCSNIIKIQICSMDICNHFVSTAEENVNTAPLFKKIFVKSIRVTLL